MMMVSTTGYVIVCIGPFLSDFSNNDASMMKNILYRNTKRIMNWLNKVKMVFDLTSLQYLFVVGRHHGGGSWFSRFHQDNGGSRTQCRVPSFSQWLSTIFTIGSESIEICDEDTMGGGGSECLSQTIQILRQHHSKVIVTISRRISIDLLCHNQQISNFSENERKS